MTKHSGKMGNDNVRSLNNDKIDIWCARPVSGTVLMVSFFSFSISFGKSNY